MGHETIAMTVTQEQSTMSFPSVGRVAVAGDVFRFVPADWEY
jgi:hypothetical protein